MRWSIVAKIFLLVVLLSGSAQGWSQCISFARSIAKPQLAPFIHDGNYNATFMEEGETADLYKTFFEGEEYRLVVAAVESLPKLRIRVLDEQRNVVFDNADHQHVQVWDFVAKTTGTMIVHIDVPDQKESDTVTGGCVAILFGIKSDSNGKRK